MPGVALEFALQDANGGLQALVLLGQLLVLSCKLSIFLADGVRLGNRKPFFGICRFVNDVLHIRKSV